MLVLSSSDLRAVLDMSSCIKAMEHVFVELTQEAFFMPLRARVSPEQSPNWMTTMPILRTSAPRRWALKQMVFTPQNRQRGRDPIQGTVVLHDGDDGHVIAVADASALTAIRTAAVTALATRTLAKRGASVVALIGTGWQARTHVEALRTVLPDARIKAWGRTAEKAHRFAGETGCELARTVEECVGDADVVCTLTTAASPVVQRSWFKPGCHINAVGSSHANAREIDAATIAAASLFVDRREAALRESGDILGAIRDGAITPEHIQAELGEVLLGRHPGRRSASEITLYKSLARR